MSAGEAIQRHRTAMVRHTLSQPMSLLVQHGLIHPGVTVFDYGCGQGDDLRSLAAAGIEAWGWDPHFCSDNPKVAADIVNLGFVLNVIEDPSERREALHSAWALSRKALAVSTMIVGQVPTEALRPFRDGFLSRRGTFQKYFSHAELRTLIADALGSAPVPAAPGIFIAFRQGEDQEEFLLRRRFGRRASTLAYRAPSERRKATVRPAADERVAPAIEILAELTRLRGRAPAAEEVPTKALELLAHERVSLPRALDLMMQHHLSQEALDAAASAMREDLLVHYALSRLNRSTTADRPSASMVRDVRAHFGSQREVLASATDYLLALGDESRVQSATVLAADRKIAALDHKGRLLLDARQSESLPGVLRVYLGCAAYLAGEPTPNSLVRIDSRLRTVSYFPLEDRSAVFPILSAMTLVDLKRQTMKTFAAKRLLIAKSSVLGVASQAQRRREAEFRKERQFDEGILMIRLD